MERFRQLSKSEITRYKALLEAKYEELNRDLPRRENITIEGRPDVAQEIEILTPDGSATLLRSVTAALRRIESGAYGTCDGCGQRISGKRLDAVPWAPLCIECQQEVEQHVLDRATFSAAA